MLPPVLLVRLLILLGLTLAMGLLLLSRGGNPILMIYFVLVSLGAMTSEFLPITAENLLYPMAPQFRESTRHLVLLLTALPLLMEPNNQISAYLLLGVAVCFFLKPKIIQAKLLDQPMQERVYQIL